MRGVESIRACAPYQRGLFTIGAVNKNETSAYEWEHLIPKVFWRGNDFEFLWSRVYREGTGKSDEALRAAANADARGAAPSHDGVHDERSVRTAREGGVHVDIRSRFHRCEIFDWGNFTGFVAGSTAKRKRSASTPPCA